MPPLPHGSTCISPFGCERRDHLDLANDVVVELLEILGGNPVFEDVLAAGLVDFVSVEKCATDPELGHVADAAGIDVPVARDLRRVLLSKNRIEDGLNWQPGRPASRAGLLHEPEFVWPCWSPELDCLVSGHLSILPASPRLRRPCLML
jgi:hypothetical protein